MTIRHIMTCSCGVETPCDAKDQCFGAVWQCPSCKEVTACVYPRGGGKVWIKVSPQDVEFYDLLKEPEDYDTKEGV
jgi:hypothetical protein